MPYLVRTASFAPLACAMLLCMPMMGCGVAASDGPPREAVSGKVTLDGQPVAQGVIQFLPASSKEGVSGGSVIEGGAYAIEAAKGLVAGQYRVTINSVKEEAAAPPPSDAPGPVAAADAPKELIPAKYNAQSNLVAEIKAGASNTLDYDLKSK